MAIKVIKHGKKPVMKRTCSVCGCEFEFELEDLQTDYTITLTSYPSQYRRYVICPDCGERIYYDTVFAPIYPRDPWMTPCSPNTPIEPWNPNKPYVTWTSTDLTDPCKDCPNKGGLRDALGNPVAGDSPCDWCKKNPCKWTCTNTTVSSINTNYTTDYLKK